ncbi:AMP-binding protein [Paralimibaculum aggregatum]|uniref:AMP-binding protein n=1 Tax=Paralimibaculum aggregatum TaxID=3036245 RepID=A0ABQ6LQ16_9RHOB|nr:phenylacetate--CoA ligase family protein [Limibaculum sp. NKW23]GMG83078.1 AMP-binding protein [Limibaculum sp. NKW23]
MAEHYDELETRAPEARERAQFESLRKLLVEAMADAPGWAAQLAGTDPASVTDRAALARLPVLRKSALGEMQRAAPPFGALTTRPASDFDLVFQSPGPIYEPGIAGADWWRLARALWAAGLRRDDVMHNAFAYHLTPAGHMLESGARGIGATVLPGGVGNSEAQATAAAETGASFYAGTPDFLKTLIDKAAELGRALKITRALVSGGPLFPAMRQGYAEAGIACLQCYATADLGLIAYETGGPDGPNPGMVCDEGAIVEICRPGTGDPVPDGEVGKVVVTTLNWDYPLIRFATGDLSAVLPGASPCGRTGPRIRGWMGRADQTTKVKGMFVRPEQVAEVVRRHPEVLKARLTVSRVGDADTMTLAIETAAASAGLAAAVAETLRDVCKLRGEVETASPGSLPNDGKVIDDIRKFD